MTDRWDTQPHPERVTSPFPQAATPPPATWTPAPLLVPGSADFGPVQAPVAPSFGPTVPPVASTGAHRYDPGPSLPTVSERFWAPAAHWLPLVSHWVGPLVVLLLMGRRSARVRAEATSSLNWEITVAVLLAVGAGLSQVGVVGPALVGAVVAWSVAVHVVGAVAVARGGSFAYPLALPIVR